MIAVSFPEHTAVLGAAQDEYEPLPVHISNDAERRATMCFRLSDTEIAEIVRTRTVWLTQLTFGRFFQPIALSITKPDMK